MSHARRTVADSPPPPSLQGQLCTLQQWAHLLLAIKKNLLIKFTQRSGKSKGKKGLGSHKKTLIVTQHGFLCDFNDTDPMRRTTKDKIETVK